MTSPRARKDTKPRHVTPPGPVPRPTRSPHRSCTAALRRSPPKKRRRPARCSRSRPFRLRGWVMGTCRRADSARPPARRGSAATAAAAQAWSARLPLYPLPVHCCKENATRRAKWHESKTSATRAVLDGIGCWLDRRGRLAGSWTRIRPIRRLRSDSTIGRFPVCYCLSYPVRQSDPSSARRPKQSSWAAGRWQPPPRPPRQMQPWWPPTRRCACA